MTLSINHFSINKHNLQEFVIGLKYIHTNNDNPKFQKFVFFYTDSQYKCNLTHFGFPEIAKFKCTTCTAVYFPILYCVPEIFFLFFSQLPRILFYLNSYFSLQIMSLCQYLRGDLTLKTCYCKILFSGFKYCEILWK